MYKFALEDKPVLNKDLMFVRLVKVDNFLEIERLYQDKVISTIFPPLFNNYILVFAENDNSKLNGIVLWLEGNAGKAKLVKPSSLPEEQLRLLAKNALGLAYNTPYTSIDLNPLER